MALKAARPAADPKRPPRTFYLVKRLETETRLLLEDALRDCGLTPTLYLVLSLIDQHGEMSSAEVARRLRTAPQSANELIAALDRKALIKRRAAPENRRVLRVSLSRDGHEMLKRCDQIVDRLETELLGAFGASELATFRRMLKALADRMREHRSAAAE
jgi:DNA-binding MarR family transcriptional regulator